MKTATREIINCGTSTTMKNLDTKTLIELHETISIPSLLNNCESWLLTKQDLIDLEKIEIWSLKRILNLPPKTPTAAVRFETGTLLMELRIDKMQLLYLHKILQRPADHWTHHILNTLDQMKIGWAEEIKKKILAYKLDISWAEIEKKSSGEWKIMVTEAIEKEHIQRLLNLCYKDRTTERTKTKYMISKLQDQQYNRKEHRPSMKMSRLKAKAIVMARSGMLECAANYKNKYRTKSCKECNTTDDECHRINECKKFTGVNNHQRNQHFDYNLVYSDSKEDLLAAAETILKVWDLSNGKHQMRNAN